MLKPIAFLLFSIGMVIMFLPSLRRPRRHGFYLFFALEFLMALLLLNIERWFRNPLSPAQLLSWFLVSASILLAAEAVYWMPSGSKAVPAAGEVATLVKIGAYKYIRHPLYASLFVLGWAIYLKQPSVLGLVVVHGAMFSVIASAKVEEKENLEKFGSQYADYVRTTKKFIPFIY